MTNVVEIRSLAVKAGIKALMESDAGTPADPSVVIAAIKDVLQSTRRDNTFLEWLSRDMTGAELTADHREQVYDACAQATAVIPRHFDMRTRLSDAGPDKHRECHPKYRWFTPAWEIPDLLLNTFGDRDPGIVIAEHIDEIFSRSRLVDPALGIYLRPADRPDFTARVSTVLAWVGRSTGIPDDEIAICEFITASIVPRDEPILDGAWPALCGALTAPQKLVTTLINELCSGGYSLSERCAEHMAELTVRAFAALAPEHDSDMIRESVLTALHDPAREFPTHVESAEILEDALDRRRALAQRGETLPVMPPQLLPLVLNIDGFCEKVLALEMQREFLVWHVDPGIEYAREHLSGHSPYALEDSYYVAVICAEQDGDVDLRVQLCSLLGDFMTDFGDSASRIGLSSLPARFGNAYYDDSASMNNRVTEYAALFSAARADGFEKLASAIASFFVASQSYRYRGRLGSWSKVSHMLKTALSLPGRDALVIAVSHAAAHAEKSGDALTSRRLRDFLHTAGEVFRLPDDGPVRNPVLGLTSQSSILEALESYFGTELFGRLSADARARLMDAHISVERLRGDLLNGNKKFCNSELQGLCLPIEEELKHRLGDIYANPDFRKSCPDDRKWPKKPTIGNLLFVLEDYACVPPKLKKRIDERCSIQHDRKLLESLWDFNRTRVVGAHPEPCGIEELETLMYKLYRMDQPSEGLWMRFLGALEQ